MLKNKTSNLIFLVLVVFALIYLGSIAILAPRLVSSAVMQIVFLKDSQHIAPLIFWPNMIAALYTIYSVFLVLKALANALKKSLKTSWYLRGLILTKGQNYFIYYSSDPLAFTAGYFSPNIYLSSALKTKCTKSELQAIIAHEYSHQSALDPLRTLVVTIIKDLLPPFPLKVEIFEHYFTAIEIDADQSALATTGRLPLVSALSKILENSPSVYISASYFSGTKSSFKDLVGESKFSPRFSVLSTLLFIGIVSFSAFQMYHSNLFVECHHLVDCFYSLIKPVSIHSVVNNLPHCHDDKYLLQL